MTKQVAAEITYSDEIFNAVKQALVDALGVDDDEVVPEATLVGDLEVESIDWLDIVFRLEMGFDIQIPRGELFPEAILLSAEYVRDGALTDEAIAILQECMPWQDLSTLAENRGVHTFSNIMTVADLCRYVATKTE